MPRASLLFGMVLMLAFANTFPGFASRPGSPEVGARGRADISLAVGEMFCLNCSGLTTASLVESTAPSQPASQFLSGNSLIMTTMSWIQNDEEDAWIWRGKVRSRWESVGFDSGIFELFMRMKGAKTRLSLLDALCVPKDRMQLAQQLGLDWKAIDYHIVRLSRHGLVHEDHAFGKVKLYRLTALGETLLRLVGEFNGEIYKEARVARLDASAAHD
jgi:DNA-binding transcriptional ArsR family regulator